MAWMNRHPNLVTWAVLSIGMVAIVGYSARDVDTLSGRQWFWLVFATVLVAGLCAWIISWEADDEDDEADVADEGGDAFADARRPLARDAAAVAATEGEAPEGGAADAPDGGGA